MLPGNPALAHQLLVDAGGRMSVDALMRRLVDHDVVITPEDIQRYAVRFPDDFRLEGDEIVAVLVPVVVSNLVRGDGSELEQGDVVGQPAAWWALPVELTPLAPAAVAVIDIETTGLDRSVDQIWQIAGSPLGGGEQLVTTMTPTSKPGEPRA